MQKNESVSNLAPGIAHLSPDADRPIWSVMIPTYNCAAHLAQALESVLKQALPPELMQIVVVDDCSTADNPAQVVESLGASRVLFRRHEHNLGAIANFNACIELAQGHLLHILHGDDYVLPGFYDEVGAAFDKHPDAAGVYTRCLIVDESGELESLSPRLPVLERGPSHDARELYYDNRVRTPGAVVRRSFYEDFGGFLPSLIHTADWEMWLRVVRRGSAVAINRPLAAYRESPTNHTGRLARTGENLRDWLRLAELCGPQLPGFEMCEFQAALAAVAMQQSRTLGWLGDREGSRANRKLWRRNARVPDRLAERLREAADASRKLAVASRGRPGRREQ